MPALTGKAAKVKITAASYSTAAAEAFTSLSPTTDKTEFRITDSAKRHWTREQPPVILVNSTAHTDFAWNPVQGKVTFGTPLTVAESAQVTGTVYWLTASYLPWTRSWSMDVDTNMHDTTCFSTTVSDVQWRTFAAGLSGGSIGLGRIVDTPSTETPVWFDHLNTDQDVVVELLINSAGSTSKWEAYARVASDGFQDGTDALAEESVTLTVDGPLYMATTE